MLVKLLKNIEQGGGVKISKRTNREDVVFVKGAVVDVSDATGEKFIERGDADKYIPNESASQRANEEVQA